MNRIASLHLAWSGGRNEQPGRKLQGQKKLIKKVTKMALQPPNDTVACMWQHMHPPLSKNGVENIPDCNSPGLHSRQMERATYLQL